MGTLLDLASLVVVPSGYKEDVVYSVKPTDGSGDLDFTRSNDTATRVNSAGLIEKVRTNLFPVGSNLSSTGWTTSNATLTSGQADPNGENTAMRIQFAAAAGFAYYVSSGANQTYNRSLFIKSASPTTIRIGEIFGGTTISINVTTSYQRFNISALNFVSGSFGIEINNQNDNAAKDITIAFVQIETGDIATDYIPTTTAAVSVGMTANVPRLDYSGGGCPKLLLEPQRSNLALYSEQMDNAAWTKFSPTTVTANTAVSPDGTTNADTVSTSGEDVVRQVITLAASTVYTYSVFVKKTNYDLFGLQNLVNGVGIKSVFNLSTGVVTTQGSGHTASIVSYGNGWYRCVVTFNSGSSTSNIFDLAADGSSATLREFYCYGAQIELGSYATSYIPTLGAAVTRGADFMYKASLGSAIFGTTDGVVFLETGQCYNNFDTSATKDFISVEKDGTNWFGIGSGGSSDAPTIRFVTRIAGVVSTDAELSGLSNAKIAIKYSAANFKIFVNGSLQETVAKSIGNYQDVYFMVNASDDLNMPLKQFLVFPTALSDTQAIELTTP